jgi:preprotein translocase subunit YajC
MNLYGLKLMLADAATAPPATTTAGTGQTVPNPQAQLFQTVLIMGGMVLLMWLMIFRPQQKRAKQLETMLKGLRPGDKIVTSSGIIGVVLSIKNNAVSIRSNDTKLEILKSAVAEVTERCGETGPS